MEKVKCVLVGDGCIGKKSMARTFATKVFPLEYASTQFEIISVRVENSEERPIDLDLYLTPGQDDYDRDRSLVYPGTHVLLVCFSINSPTSYANVEAKWCPDVRQGCSNVPIILVGNKLDLRTNSQPVKQFTMQRNEVNSTPVSVKAGLCLMKKIGALKYIGI